MRRYVVVRAAIAIAVALMFASPSLAQSSQANPNAQKPKKQANQVPETGPNDPNPDPADTLERAIDNVKITVLADGTVMAELDDSFLEASTVTIAPDGSLQIEHFAGLDRAEAAVKRHAMEAPALPLLPSRPWPLWTPISEKQE
jgi:hypothetical protein